MSARSSYRWRVLALTLAAASWGIGTAISKRAVTEIPPLVLLPVQLLASLTVLTVMLRASGRSLTDPVRPPVLGWLGALNPGAAYAFSLLGLVHVSASLSVLLWALEPVLILGLAAWFLRERVGWPVAILSVIALLGMLLILADGTEGHLLGVALTVAGVACCAIYTVVARRHLGAASALQVVARQQVVALAAATALLAGATAANVAGWGFTASPDVWASAIASGVLYYAIAYWCYLTGLARVGASVAAVSFYLIPVFGIAAGALLLDERLQPPQWLGAAIVIGAVALILVRTGRPDPSSRRVANSGDEDRVAS